MWADWNLEMGGEWSEEGEGVERGGGSGKQSPLVRCLLVGGHPNARWHLPAFSKVSMK